MIVGGDEVFGGILSVKAHIPANEIDISQNHGGQLEAGFLYLSSPLISIALRLDNNSCNCD